MGWDVSVALRHHGVLAVVHPGCRPQQGGGGDEEGGEGRASAGSWHEFPKIRRHFPKSGETIQRKFTKSGPQEQ